MGDLMSHRIVTVFVGSPENEHEYTVHENILDSMFEFFRASDFRILSDFEEMALCMPEEKPRTFDMFLLVSGSILEQSLVFLLFSFYATILVGRLTSKHLVDLFAACVRLVDLRVPAEHLPAESAPSARRRNNYWELPSPLHLCDQVHDRGPTG